MYKFSLFAAYSILLGYIFRFLNVTFPNFGN